jgi:hypothetical protein
MGAWCAWTERRVAAVDLTVRCGGLNTHLALFPFECWLTSGSGTGVPFLSCQHKHLL